MPGATVADTSAPAALAALADELEAAKAAVRSYEAMLDWHVTCKRCAAQLDELAALVEGGALHCCCAWCCTGSPREQRGQGAGCPS